MHPQRLLPAAPRLHHMQGHFALSNALLERKSRCSKGTSCKENTPKAKPTQSPAPVVFWTLRLLVPRAPVCGNAQFLLLPVRLSMGAGDSSADGHDRPAISSPKMAWQFSIRNATSTFTCRHQSLTLNPGACEGVRQPLALLSLASVQKAGGVGLLFQAATPPASGGEKGLPGTSEEPRSDGVGSLQPAGQYSIPSLSPPAPPRAGAGPRWLGSRGLAQGRWPGCWRSFCWWRHSGRYAAAARGAA